MRMNMYDIVCVLLLSVVVMDRGIFKALAMALLATSILTLC